MVAIRLKPNRRIQMDFPATTKIEHKTKRARQTQIKNSNLDHLPS